MDSSDHWSVLVKNKIEIRIQQMAANLFASWGTINF
jgi:hypothetical protein